MTRIYTALLISAFCAVGCDQSGAQQSRAAAAPAAAAPAPSATTAAATVTKAVAPQHRPSGDIEFKAAFDLNQMPAGGSPQLRHGIIAKTAEWPASLYVTFKTPSGTAACTAALVGPEVMLTAAHCVPANGKVRLKYASQPDPYIAACTQHPDYVSSQDDSADYALCKLDRKFSEFTGFLYESIDTAAMASRQGKTVVLTGFGCVSDIPGAGPPDGSYRIGTNSIEETSLSPVNPIYGAALYSGSQDNNLITKDDSELANLCPGDSGGPAFLNTGEGVTRRVVIGVNSRVFYRDATKTSYGASLVSSTGTTEFIDWAKRWADPVPADPAKKLAVCGLSGSPAKCRT